MVRNWFKNQLATGGRQPPVWPISRRQHLRTLSRPATNLRQQAQTVAVPLIASR